MSILKVGMYASSRIGANQNYLTFSSDAPFSISFTEKRWDGVLEYSTDAQNWYEWDASAISSVGNVIYLRGLGNTVITNGTSVSHAMTMTSPTNSGISCTGNIMALLDYKSPETAVISVNCFAWMFGGPSSLTEVEIEIPAVTLANACCASMFRNNTSLTIAEVELPATTLAQYCYANMFNGCTNITTAPELPATTLAQYCYANMFNGCTNIRISETQTGVYQKPWRIPTVGTGAAATNWNSNMLAGTGGTFTSNPAINTTYYQAN
jgi:hypothetical protein